MKKVFWFGPAVFTRCRGGIQPGKDRLVNDVVVSTFTPQDLQHMVIVGHTMTEVEHVGSAVDLDYFIHKYPHFKRPLAKATGVTVVATLGNIVKVEAREELTEEQKQQQAVLEQILAETDPITLNQPTTPEPKDEGAAEGVDDKKPRGRPKKAQ